MPDFGLSSSIWLSRDLTPLMRFGITAGFCAVACAFMFAAAFLHTRRLLQIPIRIHVAGTRGKSSTVRLIAMGFRQEGFRVVAKVTGTEPAIILPDGLERPIRRWGAPAIREQRAFVATAHRLGANVIVAEAMAIQPEYLSALERFYIRATDLVVTNVRPDHKEQLGLSDTAMAEAIAECMPKSGRLFVSEEAAVPILCNRAKANDNQVVIPSSDTRDPDPENVNFRLAAAVCHQHGIQIDDFENIRTAASEIGSFRLMDWPEEDGRIRFANAFACNDAGSLVKLWRYHQTKDSQSAFFLSPRSDRPIRTREFLAVIAQLAPGAQLFIASRNFLLARLARANGLTPQNIHLLSPRVTSQTLRDVAARLKGPTIVWGIGNFKGPGAQLTRLIQGVA